jgi:hypothetical protein
MAATVPDGRSGCGYGARPAGGQSRRACLSAAVFGLVVGDAHAHAAATVPAAGPIHSR